MEWQLYDVSKPDINEQCLFVMSNGSVISGRLKTLQTGTYLGQGTPMIGYRETYVKEAIYAWALLSMKLLDKGE